MKTTIRNRKHTGTYPWPIGPERRPGPWVEPIGPELPQEWGTVMDLGQVWVLNVVHDEEGQPVQLYVNETIREDDEAFSVETVTRCAAADMIDPETTWSPDEWLAALGWQRRSGWRWFDTEDGLQGQARVIPCVSTCHDCGAEGVEGRWITDCHGWVPMCPSCITNEQRAQRVREDLEWAEAAAELAPPETISAAPAAADPDRFLTRGDEDRAGIDWAEERLLQLDAIARQIDEKEDELDDLRRRRATLAHDAIHLDGQTAGTVAARLGISSRRVWKMIETPKPEAPTTDRPLPGI